MSQQPTMIESPCINWSGAKNKSGYGTRRFQGKSFLAHRAAWIERNGQIPAGLCVLHKCDNPSCVNPDHLFLGTQIENIADCKNKGRISRASRNAGASHGESVITEQTAIRLKMLKGLLPLRVMAKAVGMTKQGVWDISTGRNWKHVCAQTRYGF